MAFALLALAAAGLVAAPQAAGASTFYGHVGEFGGAGSADGKFGVNPGPGRLVAHEASGKLFAADTGNDRIQVFDPVLDETHPDHPATFDFAFDGGGALADPIGIAMDQSSAEIYVTTVDEGFKFVPDDPNDPTSYTLNSSFSLQFSSFATFGELDTFNANPHRGGIALDPDTGDLLVLVASHDAVWRYAADGTWEASFDGSDSGDAFEEAFDLAVDSNGDILVADLVGGEGVRVERFDGSEASFGDHLGTLPMPSTETSFWGATVATNTATDEVLVGHNTDEERLWRIAQFEDDALVAVLEADPPERFEEALYGLGVRGQSPGRLYGLGSQTWNFDTGGADPRVQTFDAIPPPAVSIDPVDPDTVTTAEAEFTGSIDDHADRETDWRFEYGPEGTDPATWDQAPDTDGTLDGTETLPFAVDAAADGLEPNTDYEVRLCADNGVEVCTDTETFLTEPTAPVAETGEAHSVSATGATFVATVDPRNSETEYFFEYGTDQSYGSQTEPASAGDGGQPVQVTTEVEGLDPATTYHFRVVATNVEFPDRDLGDAGDDATLRTRPAADSELPERGYELVSLVDNNGVFAAGYRAAPSGDAYVTFSLLPTPTSPADNGGFMYLRMTRNDDGSWSPDPHMPTPPVDPDEPVTLGVANSPLLSGDLSLGLFETQGSYHPLDQNYDGGPTGEDIYTRNTETGELAWLSRDRQLDADEPQTDPTNAGGYQYLSPDGSIAIFASSRQLLDSHEAGTGGALYKWDSGELTHVSQDNNGENIGGGLGLGNLTRNAVSPEGDRVVFTDGLFRGPIYVRIDDERTVEVGGGDDPDLGGDARYFGADSETTEILYVRNGTLYLFDVAAESSTKIASPVGGVFAVSDDADRIYFSSPDELTPEAGGADRYLYLAERSGGSAHEVRFISALHPDDNGITPSLPATQNDADTDSEGSILAFTSRLELVPGRRNGGFPQVYVYEADIDRLYCASCPPDGSEPAGRGDIGAKGPSARAHETGDWVLGGFGSPRMPAYRNVAESGAVFFQSNSVLTPGVAGTGFETYEWRGGEIQLVSSGRAVEGFGGHEHFRDASADGETVFFHSRQDLVPESGAVSGVSRVYAARVGGGFVPPERNVDCVGDECREPAHVPEVISPGTEQGKEPRAAAPGDRQLRRRCALLAQRFLAVKRRAIALRRAALRSDDASRRRAIVRRYRLVVRRAVVLRRATIRCRRAVR